MSTQKRAVPTCLKALGRKTFPEQIDLPSGHYCLDRILKHDFFAATGLFRSADGRQVVLKIGRQADILGLPAKWIGWMLTRREARIYQALSNLEGVPDFAGMWGEYAFAHDYVPGHPMRKNDAPKDQFFHQLEGLIKEIHCRNMAYVDLEKHENIIVGEDGRPYLIDFQISWYLPGWWGTRFTPLVWLRKKFQHMDEYHLQKHRQRNQFDQPLKAPFYIKVHRAIVRPLQKLRRGALKKLDPNYASSPH